MRNDSYDLASALIALQITRDDLNEGLIASHEILIVARFAFIDLTEALDVATIASDDLCEDLIALHEQSFAKHEASDVSTQPVIVSGEHTYALPSASIAFALASIV